MNKAATLQHIEKIRFKSCHLSATRIILVLRYLQQNSGTRSGQAAAGAVRCGIIRCACLAQAERPGVGPRLRLDCDDVDGHRSDERHLARRGRRRHDRNRRQAGEGVRPLGVPALYRNRAPPAAPCPDGSRASAAARCAAGHSARGRARGHGGPCRGRGQLYRAKPHRLSRTSISSVSMARPCCTGRPSG